MRSLMNKTSLAIGAGVLSVGLFGAAAFAAFGPNLSPSLAAVDGPNGPLSVSDDRGTGKLHQILDDLVKKGTITAAQRDAILQAIKNAAKHPKKPAAKADGRQLHRVVGDLLSQSAQYLGIPASDLRTKLSGHSLADLANNATGKSRQGLVDYLSNAANSAIDKAVQNNKLTADAAAKLKAAVPDRVAKFVDHTFPTRHK